LFNKVGQGVQETVELGNLSARVLFNKVGQGAQETVELGNLSARVLFNKVGQGAQELFLKNKKLTGFCQLLHLF